MIGVRISVLQDVSLDQGDYATGVKGVSQLRKVVNKIFMKIVDVKHYIWADGVERECSVEGMQES